MTKKNFQGGIDSLIGSKDKPKRGRPQTLELPDKSTQVGLEKGKDRVTFIIDVDDKDKLKAVAWYKRITQKAMADEMVKAHLRKFEKEYPNHQEIYEQFKNRK